MYAMIDTKERLALPPMQPSPRKIFDEVVEHIAQFYDAPESVLTFLGLFVMLTYVFEVFDAVPYLQVVGDPSTGKTRLGELLELLTFEARLVARMSVAAVYRFIDERKGTLIIDEQRMEKSEMRDVLNAGYKRSGTVMLVDRGQLLELPCFGPKVLIANDPVINEALESRLITVVSRAARRPLDRFLLGPAKELFDQVVHKLAVFSQSHRKEVAAEYRRLAPIEGLSDREFDIGAPLIAIAKVIDTIEGIPVQPIIESFLIDLAAKRKTKRCTESETVSLARLVLEFVSHPHHDARKNPQGEGVFLATDLWLYANESRLLDKTIASTKVLAEKLHVRGLIESRRVVDVDPECAPRMTGRLRTPTNTKRPRIQRVVYKFNLQRARELAGGMGNA